MSSAALSTYAAPAHDLAPTRAPSFRYTGTGGDLFVTFLVGSILTAITFGIYLPWFIVKLNRYFAAHTEFETRTGTLRFDFQGTGGDLFVKLLVGGLLTSVTLGLYAPWFVTNLIKYNCDGSTATGADGTKYGVRYAGTGGALFVALFVGLLLSSVTFGLYAPWFLCRLYREVAANAAILENGEATGTAEFVGQGGDLFGPFVVGLLLTAVTFGIYSSWLQITINRFVLQHARLHLREGTFSGDFHGTGGGLFVKNLVGSLLTMVTFGLYGAWFTTAMMRFQLENTSIDSVSA
jgi:uncharacterized membrane protein YjgN (DUF898 family)